MNLVEFLTSDRAQRALEALADRPFDPVRDVPMLRKSFDLEEAAALADMASARGLAEQKFGPLAARMVYGSKAVQQATPHQVAEHRARRFVGAGSCVDLGCGIGGDAMWLGPEVIGVDLDFDRLAMARHNVEQAGARLLPVRADVGQLPALGVDVAFADPARRDEQDRRIFDVRRYRPPLGLILDRWRPAVRGMAVKLHPGVDLAELPSSEIEFVSLGGDLKEACLWLGDFAEQRGTRATVLPAGVGVVGRPLAIRPEPREVGAWLFEPDPAVIRAGLIGDVAARFGLFGIDVTIAYLTGSDRVDTPLLTGYAVEEVMPFSGKRVKGHLRERNVGTVAIKKRGSPIDPERFRRSLGLSGPATRVVFLTRAAGEPVAIVAHPSTARQDQPPDTGASRRGVP